MTFHPKTSGAAVGASLGTVIVSILASIHGIHLTPEANAAIPTFLALLGSFLVEDPPDPITLEDAMTLVAKAQK